MILKRIFAVAFVLLLVAGSARAEDYIVPTWPDLARTLVRFNAIDLKDDALIDDYAIITECELYTNDYADDFKWNQVRNAIRQSVKINLATFPTSYRYNTVIQLDRYDFKDKIYRFIDKEIIRNVNAFLLIEVIEGTDCNKASVKNIPRGFRAVLDTPLYIYGMPMTEKDGAALLQRMENDGNDNRTVYVSFDLRIVYIEPFRKTVQIKGGDNDTRYLQSNATDSRIGRLDARLDAVNFYEDKAMTKLIYSLTP